MRGSSEVLNAEFNSQGRNVFPQFVKEVDPDLRPGDEVIIVNEDDAVVAVGKLMLAPVEIPFFKGGVAVKVRQGVSSGN